MDEFKNNPLFNVVYVAWPSSILAFLFATVFMSIAKKTEIA